MILERYHSAMGIITPDLKRLFTPHVNKMRTSLEPGLAEITWTNLDWVEFTDKCLEDIDNFRYQINFYIFARKFKLFSCENPTFYLGAKIQTYFLY